jgi:hypothetical protein
MTTSDNNGLPHDETPRELLLDYCKALPDALGECLAAVDGTEVLAAIRLMPQSYREQYLRSMEAPSPKAPHQVTANIVLQKLRHRRRLVHGFCTELREQLAAVSRGEAAITDLRQRWPDSMLRLALVDRVMLSRQPVDALRLLLSEGLLPTCWSEHAPMLIELVTACPEKEDADAHEHGPEEPATEEASETEGEAAAVEPDVEPQPVATQVVDAMATTAGDIEHAPVTEDVVPASENGGAEPDAGGEALDVGAAFAQARRAAAAVTAALEQGRAPSPADLTPPSGLGRLLEAEATRLERLLGERGVSVAVVPTAEGIAQAHERLSEVTRPHLAEVRRCAHATGHTFADDLVRAATSLLAQSHWDETQTVLASFCSRLCSLADADPNDVEELLRRDEAVRDGAPDALLPLVLLVQRGLVTLAAGADGPEAVEAESVPDTHSRAAESTVAPEEDRATASEGPVETAPGAAAVADASSESVEEVVDAQGEDGAAEHAEADVEGGSVSVAGPQVPDAEEAQMQGQFAVPEEGETVVSDPAAARLAVAELLARGSPGLAYWAAQSSSGSSQVSTALRACVLTEGVRSAVDECARALGALVNEHDARDFLGDADLRLLGLATATRAALVAGYSGVQSYIPAMIAESGQAPELCALAQAAADAAHRGVIVPTEALSPPGTAAQCEAELARRGQAIAELRRKDPRYPYAPARHLWAEWTADDGVLGRMFTIAAAGGTGRVEEVRRLLAEANFDRLIRQRDRDRRRAGGGVIDGTSRRRLAGDMREAVGLVTAWVRAAERLAHTGGSGEESDALRRLRSAMGEHGEGALAELVAEAAQVQPLRAAAARAATRSLQGTLGLVNERPLAAAPGSPSLILAADLLRSDTPLGVSLEPRGRVNVEALMEALQRGYEQAFQLRSNRQDHVGTGAIIELLDSLDPALAARLRLQREAALHQAHEEIEQRAGRLRVAVARARRRGLIDEEQLADIVQRLNATVDPARIDLDAVNEALETIETELGSMGVRSQDAIRERVLRLQEKIAAYPNLAERLEELIRHEDVGTAEVLLESVQAAEPLPSMYGIGSFSEIALVLEGLRFGINEPVLEAVRQRRGIDAADFSRLSEQDAERVAEALRAWRDADWAVVSDLRAPLALCGIEYDNAAKAREPGGARGARADRSWFRLDDYRPTEPLLPGFGSDCAGSLRVLLTHVQPNAQTLANWIVNEGGSTPVMVLHKGTMAGAVRQEFGDRCRQTPQLQGRAIAVIDDAVLVFAAMNNDGQLGTVMRATMPFCSVNPYIVGGAGAGYLPDEMFYGREGELRGVLDPRGTCLLYGGRQLGKSAVLKAAERRFAAASPAHVAVYVSNCEPDPEEFWGNLGLHLSRKGVCRAGSRGHDTVRADIELWLAADPTRRILALLDESDRFFEADADSRFGVTVQVNALMAATERRFKPVFAGLQSVQRFASLPNQPFAQLSEPKPIGPLQAQDAYNLIAQPLATLGFDFEDEDLVNRILAFTNYQPALLQLVGRALTRSMQAHSAGAPPRVIDAGIIDRVEEEETVLEGTKARFGWTLDLDQRYRVVAFVVALAVHDEGTDTTLSLMRLRELCNDAWPQAFLSMRSDAFRALLDEMVGLGVLVHSRKASYRLKSLNVLRLLGSAEEIEHELQQATTKAPPLGFIGDEVRECHDGVRSPLSSRQVSELLRRRNQLRVVVGTQATLVDRVQAALAAECARAGAIWEPTGGRRSYYRQALRDGRAPQYRLVFSDLLAGVHDATITESLQEAKDLLPARDVTRSVVLEVGPENVDWLCTLMGSGGDREGLIVPLRRYDELSLRAWAVETASFNDTSLRGRLLQVSGGWPLLIDRVEEALADAGQVGAVDQLAAFLGSDEGARAMVEAAGILDHPLIAPVWEILMALGDTAAERPQELAEMLGEWHAGGAAIFGVLQLLEAIERLDDGTVRPEPVLAAAWRRVRSTTRGAS